MNSKYSRNCLPIFHSFFFWFFDRKRIENVGDSYEQQIFQELFADISLFFFWVFSRNLTRPGQKVGHVFSMCVYEKFAWRRGRYACPVSVGRNMMLAVSVGRKMTYGRCYAWGRNVAWLFLYVSLYSTCLYTLRYIHQHPFQVRVVGRV